MVPGGLQLVLTKNCPLQKPLPFLPMGCTQGLPGSLKLDTFKGSEGAEQWLSCLSPEPNCRGCSIAHAYVLCWSPNVRSKLGEGPRVWDEQTPRSTVHAYAQQAHTGTYCPTCTSPCCCLQSVASGEGLRTVASWVVCQTSFPPHGNSDVGVWVFAQPLPLFGE